MKKILEWLAFLILVPLIASALFHSCKYHGHYDDGNIIKIAYRGVEQFWHKHDNEYRIPIKELLKYKGMSKNEVYAEVEGRQFIESSSMGAEDNDGYYKWRYKSKSTQLSKYEIAYAEMEDTTLLIYTIPEKEYVADLLKQIKSDGFIETKTDTLPIAILHLLNNSDIGIKIVAAETTTPDGKPSQFIVCRMDEFSAIQRQLSLSIQ